MDQPVFMLLNPQTRHVNLQVSRDSAPTVPTLSSAALRRLHSGGPPTRRFVGCGTRKSPTHELSVALAVCSCVVIDGRALQVPAGCLGRTSGGGRSRRGFRVELRASRLGLALLVPCPDNTS